VAQWLKTKTSERGSPFVQRASCMQDFTGVPAVVDLAAMRDAMKIGRRSQEDQSAGPGRSSSIIR
jgi:aconitase A